MVDEQGERGPAAGEPPAVRQPVVGIGASAGGLEALERFFAKMPADSGLAFVVVQHLSPDHKSLMVELLSKHTAMRVCRAEDGLQVEPDVVYLLPPKKSLVIEGDRLKLADRPGGHAISLPIDLFFASLAEARGEAAVGIVLSGTGSDGARGVREIKAAGGSALVQDAASAKFDGMPRAAISTGLVDAVLPPEEMPERLIQLFARFSSGERLPLEPREEIADDYSTILTQLRRQTDIDFTSYKASTILRRIDRRMSFNAVPDLHTYARLVEATPREAQTLAKELLIGVTRFFRDPEAFEALRAKVIRPILESARWDDQIRVWVTACSTGEEAYSLAMTFTEEMEAAGKRFPLKVFATDVDREAVEYAGRGLYPESIAADVSAERLARFFTRRGDAYQVGREIRASVLFAPHSVVRDPPFTRVDLVSCRNLLIYLEPPLQRRVLSTFHFALKPGRFMFLGPSESLGDLECFETLDARWKLFQGTGSPRASLGETLVLQSSPERARGARAAARAEPAPDDPATEAFRWLIGEFAPTALLVTDTCELVHVFGDPGPYLTVREGRATLGIVEMMARPLGATVSTAVHQATHQNREVRYAGVRLSGDDDTRRADVRVVPLQARRADRRMLLVLFEAPRSPPAGVAVEPSLDVAAEQRLADLQDELQYTKENLQATIEELETSNEELQATNEELLSSNEELQSTNEELQSLNEELHTVNTEYQAKIQELSELNADLDNLLRATDIGTLFLDGDLAIRRFTPAVTTLVNVIARDVGRSIEDFSLNFEAPWFLEELRRVRASGAVAEREFTAGARRWLVRILPYVHAGPEKGLVVTFIDVTLAWREAARLQAVLDAHPGQMAVLDPAGRIVLVNRAWTRFGEENGNAALTNSGVGTDYLAVCGGVTGDEAGAAQRTRAGLEAVLAGRTETFTAEYPCHSPTEERWFVLHATPLPGLGGAVVSHIDVSARKRLEQRLADLEGRGPAGR